MPRAARPHSTTSIYHIIFRGVNQQDIFEDDEDRQMFLLMLSECLQTAYVSPFVKQEETLRVYTYCLMTNHVHLLCREILTTADKAKLHNNPIGTNQKVGISATMHRLGRKYSMWFNNKYGRTGHLFQDRFNSECIEDNHYFITVFRYIARNPYKANIVADPNDYQWSGWYEYLHPTHDSFLSRQSVLEKWTMQELTELVHAEPEGKVMDYEDVKKPVTDKELKALMQTICGGDTVAYVQSLPKEVQKNIAVQMIQAGGGWKQVSRMTGLTVPVIRTATGYVIPSHKR